MERTQSVQELKAERVQEELVALAVAAEPFQISLKAERVQEPAAVAVGASTQGSSGFALSLSFQQKQPVKIEVPALGTIITL